MAVVAIVFFEKLGGKRYGDAFVAEPCFCRLDLESTNAWLPFAFAVIFSLVSGATGTYNPWAWRLLGYGEALAWLAICGGPAAASFLLDFEC